MKKTKKASRKKGLSAAKTKTSKPERLITDNEARSATKILIQYAAQGARRRAKKLAGKAKTLFKRAKKKITK